MATASQETPITVTYEAIDGYHTSRPFKTLAGARKFATDYIGDSPEVYEGSSYAVSFDGIGRITCSGIPVYNLFFDPPAPEPEPVVPTTYRGILKLEQSVSNWSLSLSEQEAEYYGECARYGDAGPGSGLRLREIRADLGKERALLAAAFETPAGQAIIAKREKRRLDYWNKPENRDCCF